MDHSKQTTIILLNPVASKASFYHLFYMKHSLQWTLPSSFLFIITSSQLSSTKKKYLIHYHYFQYAYSYPSCQTLYSSYELEIQYQIHQNYLLPSLRLFRFLMISFTHDICQYSIKSYTIILSMACQSASVILPPKIYNSFRYNYTCQQWTFAAKIYPNYLSQVDYYLRYDQCIVTDFYGKENAQLNDPLLFKHLSKTNQSAEVVSLLRASQENAPRPNLLQVLLDYFQSLQIQMKNKIKTIKHQFKIYISYDILWDGNHKRRFII